MYQSQEQRRMKQYVCIVLLLSLSLFANAQENDSTTFAQSTDTITFTPTQDSSALTKADANIIDRVMQLFEYENGRTSVKYYPSMGIDPASGMQLGVLSLISIAPLENKKISFYRPTSISTLMTYSTKHWLDLKSDMRIYTKQGFVINNLVQYQISPDKFYGIGNDTLNTNPIAFDIRDFQLTGNVSKSISSVCYLGFTLNVSHRAYQTGEMSNEDFFPVQKNKFLLGFGPYFSFDRRDNVNYPTHGEHVTIDYTYFAPHSEDAYSFFKVDIDAKKFITLYKDYILATQLFLGYSSGDMPFYSLYQLGGQTRLRGISNKYMYIDKCAYYAQCELRKHIWNRFGITVFGGVGNTYETFSDIGNNTLKYVYGAGFRLQSDTKNKINLRIDYGRGSFGDSGIYMTMREAF